MHPLHDYVAKQFAEKLRAKKLVVRQLAISACCSYGEWVEHNVLAAVAHRQYVFTLPGAAASDLQPAPAVAG